MDTKSLPMRYNLLQDKSGLCPIANIERQLQYIYIYINNINQSFLFIFPHSISNFTDLIITLEQLGTPFTNYESNIKKKNTFWKQYHPDKSS